jgi:integrase
MAKRASSKPCVSRFGARALPSSQNSRYPVPSWTHGSSRCVGPRGKRLESGRDSVRPGGALRPQLLVLERSTDRPPRIDLTIIGPKPIATVTRHEVEEVVQALDRAVRSGELRWKTATNVWGVVTKMMTDAGRSKTLSLRVRNDNPARDVEGPDRGVERAGPYLFPSEFLAVMQCRRVPARWKRLIMLATHLYVRVGELEALEWNSVDFEHGYVLLHQSADADTGAVKPTKTKDVRKVPIEQALIPLLRKMSDEASTEGRVVGTVPPRESLAARL